MISYTSDSEINMIWLLMVMFIFLKSKNVKERYFFVRVQLARMFLLEVLVARGMGFDLGVAVRLGAAADFLWALLTVIDDMYDNDFIRAGDPFVWMRLGKEKLKEEVFY